MAGQQIPGPQGITFHPLLLMDRDTLARAQSPLPGVPTVAVAMTSLDLGGATGSLTEEQVQTLVRVMAFCQDMEDASLAMDIREALARDDIGFGKTGDNAEWDPVSSRITVHHSFVHRVLRADILPGTVDLAATLAHELEHWRHGRLNWALGAFADANRAIGESWASWGVLALTFYWYSTPVPYCAYAAKQAVNWTIGNINRGEHSAWRVGLQKRLTWARHEHQRLKQLQSRNAARAEQLPIAQRLKAICDDFLVTYNDSRGKVLAQIGDLELETEDGKTIMATAAVPDMQAYLQDAHQVLTGK